MQHMLVVMVNSDEDATSVENRVRDALQACDLVVEVTHEQVLEDQPS